jgi:hypothetical protein
MGGLYAMDPHDQAAVQLGKDATYALMGKPGYADLAKRGRPAPKRDRRYLI